jgi:hypothetical protein
MFVGDEVMKGSLASFAFEAMEIASYSILITVLRIKSETKKLHGSASKSYVRNRQWQPSHFDEAVLTPGEKAWIGSQALRNLGCRCTSETKLVSHTRRAQTLAHNRLPCSNYAQKPTASNSRQSVCLAF